MKLYYYAVFAVLFIKEGRSQGAPKKASWKSIYGSPKRTIGEKLKDIFSPNDFNTEGLLAMSFLYSLPEKSSGMKERELSMSEMPQVLGIPTTPQMQPGRRRRSFSIGDMQQIPQLPDGIPSPPEMPPLPLPGRRKRSSGAMSQLPIPENLPVPPLPELPEIPGVPLPVPGRRRRSYTSSIVTQIADKVSQVPISTRIRRSPQDKIDKAKEKAEKARGKMKDKAENAKEIMQEKAAEKGGEAMEKANDAKEKGEEAKNQVSEMKDNVPSPPGMPSPPEMPMGK